MKKENLISGGEAVIKSLIDLGVKVIFGIPGGAILPTYDALYNFSKKIHHVLTRHEQGAIHAAEGYAKSTGKVGVCFATSGPGATNLVTGITSCMMDSVPVVCITGQVAKSVIGTDAFQEADIIGITVPITKWNYQITEAKEIPQIIAKAFYLASTGRPGPVLLDLPRDVQTEKLNYYFPKKINIEGYSPNLIPNIKQIKMAATLLNEAKKPLILAGRGVLISRASKELILLAKKGSFPVATTLLGISSIPSDHSLFVGMVGMHGNYAPNILIQEADVILAVGMRFDDRVTGKLSEFALNSKIIHIDIDPAELNKNVKAKIPIVGDAKISLKELIKYVKKRNLSSWLSKFKKLRKIEEEKVIKKMIFPKGKFPTMPQTVHILSKLTKGKAIIVSDVGQNQMIPPRYYNFQIPCSYISSGGLGPMGFGLPAAIGAKIGNKNREVVAVLGDGGFQMTIQELAVINQENLPLKIIVFNNSYLGMVRQWQELFYQKRYSQTFLTNPDFLKIVEGYGIEGERVEKKEQVEKALKRLVKSKKAYFVEVVIDPEEKVFPMVPPGAPISQMRFE
jgi:acetolactate synthase-1/2/3 large subunit